MPSDPVPTLSPEEQEAVRAELRALMAAEGLSQKALSVLCGVPYGTFSAWMGGSYAGRGDRIAEAARRGIEAHRAKARTRALAPKAPGFVATPTAEAIGGVLEHAQHMPELVVITGGPGVGKTTTAQAYRARHPNVWLLTGEPVHGTPRALLDELADTLGLAASGLSSQRLSRAVTARLRGTGALVIVDEAQHLTSQTLDQLRALHDLAEIGIALLGNETVHARLEGGTRAAHYAQLYSRVGMRLARPKPQKSDIDALLDAWGVEGKAERALLHLIGRKPGALRGLTKVLRIAHMLAGAVGAEAVAERHLRLAWGQYAARETIEPDEPAERRAA
jgi:DNA transposition AAA+ family ATPase